VWQSLSAAQRYIFQIICVWWAGLLYMRASSVYERVGFLNMCNGVTCVGLGAHGLRFLGN
jgi:hypothetical protein